MPPSGDTHAAGTCSSCRRDYDQRPTKGCSTPDVHDDMRPESTEEALEWARGLARDNLLKLPGVVALVRQAREDALAEVADALDAASLRCPPGASREALRQSASNLRSIGKADASVPAAEPICADHMPVPEYKPCSSAHGWGECVLADGHETRESEVVGGRPATSHVDRWGRSWGVAGASH